MDYVAARWLAMTGLALMAACSAPAMSGDSGMPDASGGYRDCVSAMGGAHLGDPCTGAWSCHTDGPCCETSYECVSGAVSIDTACRPGCSTDAGTDENPPDATPPDVVVVDTGTTDAATPDGAACSNPDHCGVAAPFQCCPGYVCTRTGSEDSCVQE